MLELQEKLQGITADLIARYDTRAPRYTSYPTAPQWTEAFTADDFASHLGRLPEGVRDVSLYLHLPFCRERCTFCGCNVVISKYPELAAEYVVLLERELDLLLALIPPKTELLIRQLHWGGGTPNYFTPRQMEHLHGLVKKKIRFAPDAEVALECDPRHLTQEHVSTLAALGFNRASLGVQDTDPHVQAAVNRRQSRDTILHSIQMLRAAGFGGINIDMIYGLPLQTVETWRATLEDMALFAPDRVAMYGFAYIPSKIRQQTRLDPKTLPDSRQRLDLFLEGLRWFTSHGYQYIGLDHFARESDELAVASRNHSLRRNFMGYTTLAGTDLLALGLSSIAHTRTCFVQSEKHLAAYKRAVLAGRLPVERGMALSEDDRIRDRIIQDLMCFSAVHMDAIENDFGIKFETTFANELERLQPLADDGLLTIRNRTIQTTLLGQILLRNIASVFDGYLKADATAAHKPIYSKTI